MIFIAGSDNTISFSRSSTTLIVAWANNGNDVIRMQKKADKRLEVKRIS